MSRRAAWQFQICDAAVHRCCDLFLRPRARSLTPNDMSSATSADLRTNIMITRTSLASGSVSGGHDEHNPANFYMTHTGSVYRAPPPSAPASKYSGSHKNRSDLPGFEAEPNAAHYFTTTSGMAYGPEKFAQQPVRTSRYSHRAKPTDIFGLRDTPRRADSSMSATHAMGMMTENTPRKVTPRFVNGKGFRNESKTPLDRNLVLAGGAPSTDYVSASHACMMYNGDSRPSVTHQFDLPQKNISTYMHRSLAVPIHTGGGAKLGMGLPLDIGLRTEATVTDHHEKYPQNVTRYPARPDHFRTSHTSHYAERPETKLVVPPGKGGHDMTVSNVPLGGDLMIRESHTQSAFLAHERIPVRPACASRGTLGTRLRD